MVPSNEQMPPAEPSRQKIFRAEVLERLGAPEQLDTLVSVTRPGAWLALGALWAVVTGFLWWAIRGELTTRVPAQGVIVTGPVQDVAATWSGRVGRLLGAVGDTVRSGDVLVELDQPELLVGLSAARARRAELARTATAQHALASRVYEARRAAALLENTQLERTAREQDTVVATWERRVASEYGLVASGLLSQEAALVSRQALYSIRDALARTRVAQRTAMAALASAEAERVAVIAPLEQLARDADREVARLRADSAERALLRSPSDGVLVERLVDRGDVLVGGQPVLRLRSFDHPSANSDGPLRAVLFVGANEGKRVRPGMSLLLSPSNTRPEDDGYLVGRVATVSESPVSPQAVRAVLRNEALAIAVSGTGAPFRVDVTLSRTPNGRAHEWTSRRGMRPPLATGTPTRAWIVVERRAPVSLVLPALRRRLQVGVIGE
jgi:HlyD family secretion protein